jgi:ATP-dependent Clp protease adapter protein ClpS
MSGLKEKDRTSIVSLDDYIKPSAPQDWNIMIDNDDVTPFEGVCYILSQVFNFSIRESFMIAMTAQVQGKAMIIGGLPDEETAQAYVDDCNKLKEELNCNDLQIYIEPASAE